MRVRLQAGSWPLVLAAAGFVVVALSFVPAWLVHFREITGEGYRTVLVDQSAWVGAARPIVSAAIVLALIVAALGLAQLIRPTLVPARLVLVGSTVVLGLLLASAVPVGQEGHASRVSLTPGWALLVAIGLAAAMVGASLAQARPSGRVLVASGLLALFVVAAGSVGRVVDLNLNEGDGRHWEAGSYTRPATGEEPAETLGLDGSTYRISDRWAGSFEWSGWTVVLDNDPACPDARGTYHAHAAEGDGLRFVAVVDTCLGGERARDLQVGIWARD